MFGYLMQAADVSQGDINVAKLVLIGTVVTTIGGVLVAYITNRRIGKPNGKGNVAEMNGEQLAKLDRLLVHVEAMDERQSFMQDLLLNHISTPHAHGGQSEPVHSAARH